MDQKEFSPMGNWRGLVEVLSAAALLHDIGHVAAGHTMEDEFSILEKHDGLGSPRVFEMLYGPRVGQPDKKSSVEVERFFGAIDETRLERPQSDTRRIPLPWTFEEGVYERFIPATLSGGNPLSPGLANPQIRDIIYLILSFKEDIQRNVYSSFGSELDKAEDQATRREDQATQQRIQFIRQLYEEHLKRLAPQPDTHEGALFQPFMADIVSNTISADLLDYLVRDGKPLKLDIRSNPRLQRYLCIRPTRYSDDAAAEEGLRLTIYAVRPGGPPRRDTVSDLIDLMRERFRFAEVVYYHPKKCVFSTMLAKALELTRTPPRDGSGIYPSPWAPPFAPADQVPHVVHLGDEGILGYLAAAAGKSRSEAVPDLVRRIQYRDEYRLIFTLDYEATTGFGGPEGIIDKLRLNGDKGRRETEDLLEATLRRELPGAVPASVPAVLLYCPQIKMQAKEVAAHVELEHGVVTPLNRQRQLEALQGEIEHLNRKYQALWRSFLFLHPAAELQLRSAPGKDLVLGAIVDELCDFLRIPVPVGSRRKGSRFAYQTLDRRVRSRFDSFMRSITAGVPRDEVWKLVEEVRMWAEVLPDGVRYPATEHECELGFAYATAVTAAADAPPRLRETWPPGVREFDPSDWLRPADSVKAEEDRKRGTGVLAAVASDLVPKEGSRRLSKSWTDLQTSVWTRLGE